MSNSIFNKPKLPEVPPLPSKPLSERYAAHQQEVENLENRVRELEEYARQLVTRAEVAEKMLEELKTDYDRRSAADKVELNRALDDRDKFQRAFHTSHARFEAIRQIVYENDVSKKEIPSQVIEAVGAAIEQK